MASTVYKNEQAIKILEDLRSYDHDKIYDLYQNKPKSLTDALNMAIQAIQAQQITPTDDFATALKKISDYEQAQADGEKSCDTCGKSHCGDALCFGNDYCDWQPKQADGEKSFKMRDATPEEQEAIDKYIKSISKPTGVNVFDFYKDKQADGDLISRQTVLDAFWQLDAELRPSSINAILDMIKQLPSVAIPQDHDGCKDCKYQDKSEYEMPCLECMHNYTDEWERAPHWIHTKECDEEFPYRCSECNLPSRSNGHRYCSNCGSYMYGD